LQADVPVSVLFLGRLGKRQIRRTSARNILTHNYEGVDPEIVWNIVDRNIPQLLAAVAELISDGE
jgi:uncharacterized protein with HEPN domain